MNPLQIGQHLEKQWHFTAERVAEFAKVSGDHNPIHLDPAYAANTIFKKPIVHGMYAAGILSGMMGNDLPGPGSIYMGQEFKFLKPIFVGETVTFRVQVAEEVKPGTYKLSTQAIKEDGALAIDGFATIRYKP